MKVFWGVFGIIRQPMKCRIEWYMDMRKLIDYKEIMAKKPLYGYNLQFLPFVRNENFQNFTGSIQK